jgi:oligosaccharide repeat unit polymerase
VVNLARHIYVIFLTLLSLIEMVSWKGYASILLLTAIIFQLILVFYLNKRKFNLLHPIFFLFITTNLSVLARTYAMVYSDSQEVISFLMMDLSYSKFIVGSLWIIVCMIFFLIGYQYFDNKYSSYEQNIIYIWQKKRFWIIISIMTLCSLAGVYVFITQIGLESVDSVLENVSKKRYKTLEDQKYDSSLGYLRLLASLSDLVVYLILLLRLSTGRRLNMYGISMLITAFCVSIFFSYFVSSRTSILTFLLNMAIILYAYKSLNLRLITIGFASILIIFSSMTILRNKAINESYTEALEKIVVNRNLLGISKTSIVIDKTPESFPYLYGGSFTGWIFAPIPRTWWSEKPPVSISKEIGEFIFDFDSKAGVPPGVMAEAYINFGFLGFVIMMPFGFIFGFIFKKVAINRDSFVRPTHLLFYVLLAVNFTTIFFGGTIGQTMVGILQVIIPAILITKIVIRQVNAEHLLLRNPIQEINL